ncbi:MAG: SDR family oxidoreductase [Pirellulales bacterium]
MNKSTIADKVAWVTGASSGIGAALANALAAKGAAVVLSARREELLRQVQAGCAQPERHLVLPLDMLRSESFEPAVQAVLNRFGRVDVLIHCAGISQRGRAVETQLSVDRHIMELNYFGPVALTKHVLPSMLARGAGQIVVVSSLLGKFGAPERSAYCASKHALHGFFDALRAEVHARGILITVVCPGFVCTNASVNALTGDGTPHGRMDRDLRRGLTAEECAGRIVAAIERGRREAYIGRKERLGVYFSRFAPGLFSRFIRSTKLK